MPKKPWNRWTRESQKRCNRCGQWYSYREGFRGKCYDCSLESDISRTWSRQAHKGVAYDNAYNELHRTGWFYPEEGSK